jgi:hypothetical protein
MKQKFVQGVVVVLFLSIFSIACSSRYIGYNPEFSRKLWSQKKIAVLPVILVEDMEISGKFANQILKNNLNQFKFARFISHDRVEKEMNEKNVYEEYDNINNYYKNSGKLNTESINQIASKTGYKYFLIPVIIYERVDHEIDEKKKKMKFTFEYYVDLRIYGVDKQAVVISQKSRNTESKTIEYKKPEEVEIIKGFFKGVKISFEEDYAKRKDFLNSYKRSLSTAFKKGLEIINAVVFPGDCISGDCLNGKGRFRFIDGQVYVGAWKNGQAHGEGILYDRSGRVVKKGWFEKGHYKKKSKKK